MLTNRDLDECLVLADLNVRDQVDDALKEFFRPDVEMEARMLWASLPEQLKRLVRERNPEVVKAFGAEGKE